MLWDSTEYMGHVAQVREEHENSVLFPIVFELLPDTDGSPDTKGGLIFRYAHGLHPS